MFKYTLESYLYMLYNIYLRTFLTYPCINIVNNRWIITVFKYLLCNFRH